MDTTPIIFIDSDEDDQLMLQRALTELKIPHPVLVFNNGQSALDYLMETSEVPFLIMAEMSLPGLSGLELRQHIEDDKRLRQKSIPFLFMTYPVVEQQVEQAYQLTIQGLFEKKTSYEAWKDQLGNIISYWTDCYKPKRLEK